MDNWFKLNLGDAMLVNDALTKIQLSLSKVYEESNKPESMLAVYRHESNGLHCCLIVYFTAEFQRVAAIENTASCKEPPLLDSGFLAGNERLLTVN